MLVSNHRLQASVWLTPDFLVREERWLTAAMCYVTIFVLSEASNRYSSAAAFIFAVVVLEAFERTLSKHTTPINPPV